MPQQTRQLVAILFTDIVGYTAMMQQDEGHAVIIVKRYIEVLQKAISDYAGKILNDYGDGSLCSFSSATQALQCAVEIQKQFRYDPKVPLRIGLHVGEIFFESEKVMGDGVNVASRIQSLGQANAILFSKEVFDKIKNQAEFKAISLGVFEFKNVGDPMEIFALANDGLKVPKREEISGKLKEDRKKSSRRKWIITSAIAVLLLAGLFFYREFFVPPEFTGQKSVAVLPFENIGQNISEEYISDGITQDIINNLTKISSLQKVIAWFSVKGFKKTAKTLKQIATELDVAAILTGTIQKQGDKVHVIAELIDANTSKRLWGENYDYDSKDFLLIQTNVASEIVKALRANLTAQDKMSLSKRYTENVEAYKYYRKGRTFWDQRSKESYDSAESYYKKAIGSDPDYALAYAGLADCYTYSQKRLSQREAIPIAKKYAEKALSIDSNLTEALTTIAFIQSHFDYDWQGAKAAFEKIIADNPNYPIAHLYYGNVLLFSGDKEAGLRETKKALSLDPLSSVNNMVLGRNFYLAREYDSALTQIQEAINLNPNFMSSYMTLGEILQKKRLYSKAFEAFSKLPAKTFDQGINGFVFLSNAHALAGDTTTAMNLFKKISTEERLKTPYFLSYFYLGIGDYDQALSQLEYAYQIHDLGMVQLKVDPLLDPIRNEQRFKALIRKMNFE